MIAVEFTDMAKHAQNVVNKNGVGHIVTVSHYYNRHRDIGKGGVGLGRCKEGREGKADLFVCLHAGCVGGARVCGGPELPGAA